MLCFIGLLPHFQYSAHALVDALLTDGTLVDGVDHSIKSLHKILRTQHNVNTRLDALHGSLGTGVLLSNGSHLHTVGDDDVLVTQFAAQLVLQDVTISQSIISSHVF